MRPYRDKPETLPLLLLLLFFLVLTQHGTVLSQPSNNSSPYDTADQYSKVTPSMAIIIVVLIAALFFMGFFSIYIRHCNDSSSTSPPSDTLRAGGILGRSRRRGLDASVIESFPLVHYSEVKGLKIGKGALECAVCLNEFEDDETLRLIPNCDHVFHSDCVDVWLESHVTCPVCRANLSDSAGGLGESTQSGPESTQHESELEGGEACNEVNGSGSNDVEAPKPEAVLNRDRTRGRRFPRSHSTGHSLVQPGENTDRFTLKLPDEVRKRIMNRQLDRSRSLVVLPRERSSRRGYRTGGDDSTRGKYNRLEKLGEPGGRSDRWVFTRNTSILTRASSFLTRASSTIIRSSSLRSPKVAANDGEGTSTRPAGPEVKDSIRPPV